MDLALVTDQVGMDTAAIIVATAGMVETVVMVADIKSTLPEAGLLRPHTQ